MKEKVEKMNVVEAKQTLIVGSDGMEFRVTGSVWSVKVERYDGDDLVGDLLDRNELDWKWLMTRNADEYDARGAENEGSLESMIRQASKMLGLGLDWVADYAERKAS